MVDTPHVQNVNHVYRTAWLLSPNANDSIPRFHFSPSRAGRSLWDWNPDGNLKSILGKLDFTVGEVIGVNEGKRVIVAYCKACSNYSTYEKPAKSYKCTSCGAPVQLMQICPTCERWYTVEEPGTLKCEDCGIILEDATVDQFDAIKDFKPELDAGKKPERAKVDKAPAGTGSLVLKFCINCGEENYVHPGDGWTKETCKDCGGNVGELKKRYKPLIERLGILDRPKLVIVYLLVFMAFEFSKDVLELLNAQLAPNPALVFNDAILALGINSIIFVMGIAIASLTKYSRDRTNVLYNPTSVLENPQSQELLNSFINEREMMDFKKKARGLLYSRKEVLVIIIITPLSIFIACAPLPPYIAAALPSIYALMQPVNLLFTWFPILCILGSAVSFYIGIVRVMLLLARERKDFAIFHFAERLKTDEEVNIKSLFKSKPVVFSEFEKMMRAVGMLLYDICLRLLFVGIAMSIILMIFWTILGIPILATMALSIAILVVVLMLFMIPQFKVHELLADVKEKMTFGFKRIFDNVTLEYLTVIKMHKPFEKFGSWENKEDMRDDIEMLRDIYEDIEAVSTWTFNFPAVFKLIGAGIAPIALAIVQAIITL
nr:hypothetical protein [Candidatus Sigynarchaeum springense]